MEKDNSMVIFFFRNFANFHDWRMYSCLERSSQMLLILVEVKKMCKVTLTKRYGRKVCGACCPRLQTNNGQKVKKPSQKLCVAFVMQRYVLTPHSTVKVLWRK